MLLRWKKGTPLCARRRTASTWTPLGHSGTGDTLTKVGLLDNRQLYFSWDFRLWGYAMKLKMLNLPWFQGCARLLRKRWPRQHNRETQPGSNRPRTKRCSTTPCNWRTSAFSTHSTGKAALSVCQKFIQGMTINCFYLRQSQQVNKSSFSSSSSFSSAILLET